MTNSSKRKWSMSDASGTALPNGRHLGAFRQPLVEAFLMTYQMKLATWKDFFGPGCSNRPGENCGDLRFHMRQRSICTDTMLRKQGKRWLNSSGSHSGQEKRRSVWSMAKDMDRPVPGRC